MERKINSIVKVTNGMAILEDSAHQLFVVDEDQLALVLNYFWVVDPRNQYVKTSINSQTVYLHRFLMDCPKGMVINHINHQRNDDRLANLNIVSPLENARLRTIRSKNSKTGYTNITKIDSGYLLQLSGHHCGIYPTIIDALKAKISAAKKLWDIDLSEQINKEIEKIKYPVHIVD
jgi:hypothetical protein